MDGKEKPAGDLRSLHDFAKLAGVSASTVSRALSDNPLTALKTRRRIQALARKVGFSVNPAASMLRTRLTHTIGLILPMGRSTSQALSDPFCTAMLGLIADNVSSRKYDLLVKRVDPTGDDWLRPIIESRRIDGLIIFGQADQDEVLNAHADNYLPLVVWGQWRPGQKYLTVGIDNVSGGRLAGEHLIERGRTRLVFIGNIILPEFGARYQGFLSALPPGLAPLTTGAPKDHTFDDSYAVARSILHDYPDLDGVFAGSDVIASAFTKAAHDCGMTVPGDVAIVGFDDIAQAERNNPPLTTVRQDQVSGASNLCDQLFLRISGNATTSVMLPPELIVRAST